MGEYATGGCVDGWMMDGYTEGQRRGWMGGRMGEFVTDLGIEA